MNTITISKKQKYKHLSLDYYEFIINSIIKFNTSHTTSKRNIGKTAFIKDLALSVGTTTSNIYSIMKDATITVIDSTLEEHIELSALAAFNKRTKNHKRPNNSKLEKAKDSTIL